jgi:hypothetical protein
MHRSTVAGLVLVGAVLSGAGTVGAQASDTSRTDPWLFYHGCWATSSEGARGPMVCILPDSAPHRVELVSVVDDSIVARVSSMPAAQFVRSRAAHATASKRRVGRATERACICTPSIDARMERRS